MIRDFLELALEDAGFTLTIATHGEEALAALACDAQMFGAIITDIRLGDGPDGWSIGRRAREIIPEMAVVYMSGDSGYDWPTMGVPGSVMIAKPFAPDQIVTAISALMTDR